MTNAIITGIWIVVGCMSLPAALFIIGAAVSNRRGRR